MILVNNQEVRKGWQSCKQSIVDLFGKHKAEVVSARRWDERRLAYPIKGQQRATYLLVYFKSEHLTPAAIRRELDFNDSILRHLIVSCEAIPVEAHEPEAAFDETRVGEDVPPARVETGRAANGAHADPDQAQDQGSQEQPS
jgi:ribosomal protein S6